MVGPSCGLALPHRKQPGVPQSMACFLANLCASSTFTPDALAILTCLATAHSSFCIRLVRLILSSSVLIMLCPVKLKHLKLPTKQTHQYCVHNPKRLMQYIRGLLLLYLGYSLWQHQCVKVARYNDCLHLTVLDTFGNIQHCLCLHECNTRT